MRLSLIARLRAGVLINIPVSVDAFSDSIASFLGIVPEGKTPQEMQVLHRAPTDRCAFEVLQSLRTCGVAVSLGSCNQFLHGGVRFLLHQISTSSDSDESLSGLPIGERLA
jgi:hypothetical protein